MEWSAQRWESDQDAGGSRRGRGGAEWLGTAVGKYDAGGLGGPGPDGDERGAPPISAVEDSSWRHWSKANGGRSASAEWAEARSTTLATGHTDRCWPSLTGCRRWALAVKRGVKGVERAVKGGQGGTDVLESRWLLSPIAGNLLG
ncbi:hypothetical protein E2562_020014 [Oryza meyeriana var. granulata]|uniref:Uncharacterized protein n=1 Tax=Oryza meyeriana var. granulata TaxID=110450 RepID=A0A6G1FAM9_9ORYZ|nr:hypothetical protein E2562_020014 [Oryza meyeriana var. granulata]